MRIDFVEPLCVQEVRPRIERRHSGRNELACIARDDHQVFQCSNCSDEQIRLSECMTAAFVLRPPSSSNEECVSSVTARTRPAKSGRRIRSSHRRISARRTGSSMLLDAKSDFQTNVISVVKSASPGCAATNSATLGVGLGFAQLGYDVGIEEPTSHRPRVSYWGLDGLALEFHIGERRARQRGDNVTARDRLLHAVEFIWPAPPRLRPGHAE